MKNLYLIFILNLYFSEISLSQNTIDTQNTINKLNDSILVINDKISINANARTISFPVFFHKAEGAIEVVLCTKRGKAYESLLITEVTPVELQTALLLLGYKSFENKMSDKKEKDLKKLRKTDSVYLYVQWTDSNKTYIKRLENFIWSMQKGSLLNPVSWFFNGLLTDMKGNIYGDEALSMIVANYDYTSVLSLNKDVIFNRNIYGVHMNTAGEDSYAAKADSIMLKKDIKLIIGPVNEKVSRSKIKRKVKK